MKEILYFDSAASFLKSKAVIDVETDFLLNHYANSGRGVCARTAWVDNMVNDTRRVVADFINSDEKQVVFTFGATDGLSRCVSIIREKYSDKKISVLVSDLDHHSARLPWEYLANKGNCDVKVCPLNCNFDIDCNNIPCADIFVITAMSNVLGMEQDITKIIQVARQKNPNVITIVDASQYVVYDQIDVKKFNCDFLVFSGHKIGADTGVGILYIKNIDDFIPDKFGGGMIARVENIVDNNVLEPAPYNFEAGTLPLTQIAGLRIAISEISNRQDNKLLNYLYDELSKIPQIKIFSRRTAHILSFVIDDMHSMDVGALLGSRGICVRVGNMCASWIHKKIGVSGTVRVSVGPWNNKKQIDRLVTEIKNIIK